MGLYSGQRIPAMSTMQRHPPKPRTVWAEGTVEGRSHWLAGQKVGLAVEIPQVYNVNTTHNKSLSLSSFCDWVSLNHH